MGSSVHLKIQTCSPLLLNRRDSVPARSAPLQQAILIDPMQEDKENRKQPRLAKPTPDVPKENNAETGEPLKKTGERDTDTDRENKDRHKGQKRTEVHVLYLEMA